MSIRLKIWLGAMASAVLVVAILGALLAMQAPFMLAGLVVLAVFTPASWLLAWLAYHPIRDVTKTARRLLTTGDLSGRCWYPGPRDDVGNLVVVMNELLVQHDAAVGALQRLRAAPPHCDCPRPASPTDPVELVVASLSREAAGEGAGPIR
jgi:hypothetical protein